MSLHPTCRSTRSKLGALVTLVAALAAINVQAAEPADTVLKAGTLFIEAEDFNFGKGQWITNQPIGMSGQYAGGLYQDMGDGLAGASCDGTDYGIDYNEVAASNDQSVYRGTTAVEAGKRNGPAGLARGPFDVEVNHVIGWTSDGEWLNYTRRFPEPAKVYKVYARMAVDVNLVRRGTLSRVTSDPAACNQTTTELGKFNAPSTGGWDTWPDTGAASDALVEMDSLVLLGGLQTLRFTWTGGSNHDMDYLAFVPQAVQALPPRVLSFTPTGGSVGLSDLPKIEAVIEDSATIKTVSASISLDGAVISTNLTRSGNRATIRATPSAPLAIGSSHTLKLTYTDDASPAVTRTVEQTFKVSFTPFREGTLFIEAEDFNFGKGQWITNKAIGMTGPYAGGDYQGLGDGLSGADCDGTDFGVDYFESGASNDQAIYRPTTAVEAGKRNGPAGVNRGTFDVSVNHTVGWTGSAEWMNYTRNFPEPATKYKVYARMARDEAASTRGGILFRVTSDPKQCNQTTEQLGTFTGPWTGGWDTWPDAGTPQDALIEMKNAEGNTAVVTLGGLQTLRWQFANSAGDIDYLAFVPLPPDPVITSRTPAATLGIGPAGAPDNTIVEALIEDNARKVVSASLKLDGVQVATGVKTGAVTRVSYTPPQAFVPGSTHTATLIYTDDGSPAVTRTNEWTFRVTVLTSRSLFIEAEDFNFGKGNWVKDQPIGMTGPYAGGHYQDMGDGLNGAACDGSDFGIDYNDNATSDQAVYRPNTPVEAGKRNGPAGLDRGPFDVEVNHVIGWTGGGEWMNYTRVFPSPARVYKVYARMAHGDAAQTRGASLSLVTSDPTKCNQTVQELGRFSAPWTGGWDTWPDAGTPQDGLIPMRDAAGLDSEVKLGGTNTVRITMLPGYGDIDYVVFVPTGAQGLPPKVVSLKPANNASGVSDQPTIEAVIEDGEVEQVTTASFSVDGSPVAATVTKTGNRTTVRYTPATAFAAGSSHTVRLSYTDNASPPATRTADASFRVSFRPFRADTLFIEGEDFNFGKGQWVTNKAIGMTGPYLGGDYAGLGNGVGGAACDGSDLGVDYNDDATNDPGAAPAYRPGTSVEIAKPNGPAGLNRGTFDVAVNHAVGWTGTSEWMNYTRRFPEPAKQYKVYARMAHGDSAATRGGSLSRVTGDPTQCNAAAEELGTFRGPWTGGWDTWPDAGTSQDALIEMKDTAGNAAVVTLGGLQTLRWQFQAGSGDLDYIAFIPQAPSGPRFTSIRKNANGTITVEWTGGGTLEAAPAVTGPWQAVTGATSPYTFTPTAPMLFGRIRQ